MNEKGPPDVIRLLAAALSVTILHCGVVAAADRFPTNFDPTVCSTLLLKHVRESATSFLPWTDFYAQMTSRESATVLIQLPLSEVTMPLNQLGRLGLSDKSMLQVLQPLSHIVDQNVIAVVRGQKNDFLAESANLGRRYPGLKFQILTSRVTKKSFKIERPVHTVEVTAYASGAEVDKVVSSNEASTVFDGQISKVFFAYPQEDLRGLTGALISQAGIGSSGLTDHQSLLEQVRGRVGLLDLPIMWRWNGLWIVSEPAFARLKNLEGTPISEVNSRTTRINKVLLDQVKQCPTSVCVTIHPSDSTTEVQEPDPKLGRTQSPPTVASLGSTDVAWIRNINNGYLRRMIDVLTILSERSMNGLGGMQSVFELAGHRTLAPHLFQSYKVELDALNLGGFDGRQVLALLNSGRGSEPNVTRFIQAWRLLVAFTDSNFKINPFSPSYLDVDMDHLLTAVKNPIADFTPEPKAPLASPKPETEDADLGQVGEIFRFISTVLPSANLCGRDQLKPIFIELIHQIVHPARWPALEEQIRAIRFGPYDAGKAYSSVAAQDLLLEAWMVIVQEVSPRLVDRPVTHKLADHMVKIYQNRQKVAPPPDEPPQTPAAPPSLLYKLDEISLSFAARQSLMARGIGSSEIDAMAKNWHGYVVRSGLSGTWAGFDWTVLIRSKADVPGLDRLRDDGYVAAIHNGLITAFEGDYNQNQANESLFYFLVARELQMQPSNIKLNLPSSNASPLRGLLTVDASIKLKLQLKHGFSFEEFQSLLATSTVDGPKDGNDCYKLISPALQGDARFFLCVFDGPRGLKLKTFFAR